MQNVADLPYQSGEERKMMEHVVQPAVIKK